MIDLITVGRVTGRPHTIEIWFAQRESTLYLLSGGGERSDWVRNLAVLPDVRVRIGSRELSGWGRVVTEPAEVRQARDSVHDKYAVMYHGDLSGWRETALPIAVDLAVGRGVDQWMSDNGWDRATSRYPVSEWGP